ncbi:recombinase family protein [Rummeliibacillus suwonensis]|uniref:recombinase family protein n=1 Tax=Rummeliibacillus suwonensis TaxID=1306154 RepID=UPI001AAE6B3B|nr:recombinase family protein [Rummeliibacillus suwonensis]MBO2536287.1 recombinase family protein [Rummeliibacillus suwonensis]
MIKHVCIYCRRSRDELDDRLSIENQKKHMIEFVEEKGWTYDIFAENESSMDFTRPKLQTMLDKVRNNEYDAVTCTELSRLSRDELDLTIIQRILYETNTILVTLERAYDLSNPLDRFVQGLDGLLSQLEYGKTKARLQRGMLDSVKQGNYVSSQAPIGYSIHKVDSKHRYLVPNDDKYIVELVFQLYLDGMTMREIVKELHKRGISPKCKQVIMGQDVISEMLRNQKYCGDNVFGKTVTKKLNGKNIVERGNKDVLIIPNTHEPIISREVFEKAQEIRKSRRNKPAGLRRPKHELSGLVYCSKCGTLLTVKRHNGIVRFGSHSKMSAIDGYRVTKKCPCKSCKQQIVLEQVFNKLNEHIEELEQYRDKIKEPSNDLEQSKLEKIKGKRKQIKQTESKIQRVQEGYLQAIFTSGQAKEQVTQLNTLLDTLRNELKQLETMNAQSEYDYVSGIIERMKQFIRGKAMMKANEINTSLASFINKILYDNDGNTITINIIWKS